MASLSIRNLDPRTKTRLRVRAARRHRSMDAEARAILQEALAEHEATPVDLGTAIRKRFESIGGVELEPGAKRDPHTARLASASAVIVLDTNVMSELMRPAPAPAVLAWVAKQDATRLFNTSVSEAEILHGIHRIPAGKRRKALEAAARSMFDEDLVGRVLAFDGRAAGLYALIAAERERAGRPISQFDAQIAAIARAARAAVATRNPSRLRKMRNHADRPLAGLIRIGMGSLDFPGPWARGGRRTPC